MMSLAEVASAVAGRVSGGNPHFRGVSTDTRTLARGDLFIALRGERFDGHAFLSDAANAGATAAMVDRRYAGQFPVPAIVVEDTRRALGDLARHWRARFSPALVAITGSNGKTTVKEMLAAILRRHAGEEAVLATAGNLNNEIGVPLTLLKLRPVHRWCAIELGMNHKGEIAYLAGIARPTVALVNNAQREHMEFLGSVDEVAAENASVYDALREEDTAVVNADEPHATLFRARAKNRRIVDFGIGAGAVRGRYEIGALSSEIRIGMPGGETAATLAIPGLHNVRNALAAAACAYASGAAPQSIGEGLTAFRPYKGRLQVRHAADGTTVIDDSYNANPDSVRAAVDVLAACPTPTVLVLGDMGEVGEQGVEFHREVGAYALACGISRLFALGEAARHAVEAFGPAGRHFATMEALVSAVEGKTVLVKGSRFMKMERVVAALTVKDNGAPESTRPARGDH